MSLKSTNILVNDAHYRKIAVLWRTWVKFGHKRQETQQQRAKRRQHEAEAWDQFVLHLVIRAFNNLGWSALPEKHEAWKLTRESWPELEARVSNAGVIELSVVKSCEDGVEYGEKLRFLPLCATFSPSDEDGLVKQLEAWDTLEERFVAVHVGAHAKLPDPDRATGWSFKERAVLFACSPWGIDSEERMTRLINGWLNLTVAPDYPIGIQLIALPEMPQDWSWVQYKSPHLVAFRTPLSHELSRSHHWASSTLQDIDRKIQRAKQAKQAFEKAPRNAITAFQKFIDAANSMLMSLNDCPVCHSRGHVEPRPGRKADGSDATWWARCNSCRSEWGLRPCTSCGERYRVLTVQCGQELELLAAFTSEVEWPDSVLGQDVWAQPCRTGLSGMYRCPQCGSCGSVDCDRCQL